MVKKVLVHTANKNLCATEPSFVVLAPCPYEDTQEAATQLVLAYDGVKRAKARERRVNTLVYAFYFSAQLSTITGLERTVPEENM
ncbi:hypothetical protein F8M41_020681, partial [Gigaspora margarita]